MTTDDETVTRREVRERISEAMDPPIIDPTANVLQLVEASMKRQDDLRAAESKRQDDLAELERRHRAEVRELETKFRDSERAAEKARIDAQRAEDKAAIALATQRGEATASALADRVETAAKTLAAEAGSKEQRTDNRQQNQWTFQQVVTLLGIAAGAVYFIVNTMRG